MTRIHTDQKQKDQEETRTARTAPRGQVGTAGLSDFLSWSLLFLF
jgi:hypothetical protein